MTQPSAPPFTQSISFLTVSDIEASTRFYQDVLGLRPVYRRDSGVRIFAVSPSALIGLSQQPGRLPNPAAVTLSLITPSAATWHERLTAAGVRTDGPPVFKPEFGINILYAWDPDGYKVEILEMHDPGFPVA